MDNIPSTLLGSLRIMLIIKFTGLNILRKKKKLDSCKSLNPLILDIISNPIVKSLCEQPLDARAMAGLSLSSSFAC